MLGWTRGAFVLPIRARPPVRLRRRGGSASAPSADGPGVVGRARLGQGAEVGAAVEAQVEEEVVVGAHGQAVGGDGDACPRENGWTGEQVG